MNTPIKDDPNKQIRREAFLHCLGLVLALGALLAMTNEDAPPSIGALGLFLIAVAAIALWVQKTHAVLAVWILNVGIWGLTILSAYWFPDMDYHYALVLPVVIALMVIGPAASLITAAFTTAILFVLSSSFRSGALSVADVGGVWCLTVLLLLSCRPLRTLTVWAWQSHEHAQAALEQARDRQVELKQALEDLALANREMVRLNEMLSAARKAVEDARKAKEEFVANVSHELRTPLNMIIGFSDMILETPEVYAHRLPSALLADVAAIRRNSQHLADLVDDVLDLSEADTGHMQLSKEECSFSEIAQEAILTVSALFQKKSLALTMDIPEDIPKIYCDRTRIRQVLLNLLSNAGRFTEKGGACVRVRVDGGMLVISVSDTGPGMQREKLERLFEPFQQADPTIRRRYGGSGLGLAISKRLVEMHGGKIWLESEPNRGTTAFFTLPLTHDLSVDPARRWFGAHYEYTPRNRRADLPELGSNPRIVVVERGETLSKLIERHSRDLEPVLIHNSQEAERAIQANLAQALVINQSMNVGSEDRFNSLPALPFSVPILFCSIPEKRAELGEIGVQDYLVKPVSRSALFNSIKRVAPHASSVLIADDDPEVHRLFGRMLASANDGYQVLHARDGESALNLLRDRQPDVILLDLVMQGMDGWAVLETKALDRRIAHIPVIILSAKDPRSEPIISKAVTITRQEGLSAQDLVQVIETITLALKPRFGVAMHPEKIVSSPACK